MPQILIGVFLIYLGVSSLRSGLKDAAQVLEKYGADGSLAAESIKKDTGGSWILIVLGVLVLISFAFSLAGN